MDVAWMASRWDKGEGSDYINCPLDKDQYLAFHQGLLDGEKTEFREWEKDTPYFEGCMPIEVAASRGVDTLRYGPMKPVGLDDPRTGRWPYAVVQLRQDNALGTLWNMVGFQTKLKHGEQVRLFRTIPGLENAEFARLGGLHRNTFLNSPQLLDCTLRLKAAPHIRFAGQITGCEGYVESAAVGLLAGRFAAADLAGRRRPDEEQHGLEVEQQEEDRDRVVLDRERPDVAVLHRLGAALERFHFRRIGGGPRAEQRVETEHQPDEADRSQQVQEECRVRVHGLDSVRRGI
jgi:folate-dependent tRNA-U54 methylase TrmFO/GidA